MEREIYVYESHMGGVYLRDDFDESYVETCEMCGDADRYHGTVNSFKKLKQLFSYTPTEEGDYDEGENYCYYDDKYLRAIWKEYINELEVK